MKTNQTTKEEKGKENKMPRSPFRFGHHMFGRKVEIFPGIHVLPMFELDDALLEWLATQEKLNGVWEEDIALMIKQIIVLMFIYGMDLAFVVAIIEASDVDTPEKALKEIFRQSKCPERYPPDNIITRMSRLVFEHGNLYTKKFGEENDGHFKDIQMRIADCPSLYVYRTIDKDKLDADYRNMYKYEIISLVPRLADALLK